MTDQHWIRLVYGSPGDKGDTYITIVPLDMDKPWPLAVRDAMAKACQGTLDAFARLFLQQVEALVEAAHTTAEELRESGFGYMAKRLEDALSDLANVPRPAVVKRPAKH